MHKTEQAIFTNLIMIYDGKGNILVEDRKDPDWPGICLPGGHVEPGESFVASAIREVKEETGLTIKNLHLCGTKQFQNKDGARYVVFFFKTCCYSGQLQSCDEGEVFWCPREELESLNLAEGFDIMLPVFENSRELVITPDVFAEDALIFDGLKSKGATVVKTDGRNVHVDFGGAPCLGIWAKPGAKYVCIEPWYGIDDRFDAQHDFTRKERICSLEAGKEFVFPVTIQVAK